MMEIGLAGMEIEIPDREEDEEDITEKQIQFIDRLCKELKIKKLPIEPETLGKWQVSSLIDELIELRDEQREEEREEHFHEVENKFELAHTRSVRNFRLSALILFATVILPGLIIDPGDSDTISVSQWIVLMLFTGSLFATIYYLFKRIYFSLRK